MIVVPLMLVTALACPAPLAAPPAQPPTAEKAMPLAIGSAAPPLDIATWLHGDGVPAFAPGTVYIFDFWEVWCGPATAEMPRLARHARERAKDGVTVIGITRTEPKVDQAKVAAFLERKGDRLPYPIGIDAGQTFRRYLDASRRTMPTAFVVDRTGAIAWFGPPVLLDVVLPKVLDGSWKGQADADALAAADQEFRAIFLGARLSPDDAPRRVAEFEERHPEMRDVVATRTLALLANIDHVDEAAALARPLIDRFVRERDPTSLLEVANFLRGAGEDTPAAYRPLVLEAATKAVDLSARSEVEPLLTLADCQLAFGDKTTALATAREALPLATDEGTTAMVRQMITACEAK